MFILETHKTKIDILVQESTEKKQQTTCLWVNICMNILAVILRPGTPRIENITV